MKRHIVTVVIILGVALAALSVWPTRPESKKVKNINNLKNVGLAFKVHNRNTPDPRNLAGVAAGNNGNWTLQGQIQTNALPAATNSLKAKTSH
jgi:hypothetical protein